MSAPVAVSTYGSLYTDARRSVMGFLGLREVLVKYACIDRKHRADVHERALPHTGVTIPSHVVNNLIAIIHKLPRLQNLEVIEGVFYPLVPGSKLGNITHLSFSVENPYASRSSSNSGMVPAACYRGMLIQAVSDLKGLSLQCKSGESTFLRQEGSVALAGEVKSKLQNLTELKISKGIMGQSTSIKPDEIAEILQCSTNLTSVVVYTQAISNGIFKALTQSRSLVYLHLWHPTWNHRDASWDSGILAACHSLESFTPCYFRDEESLIAMIKANPNLKNLDLSEISSPYHDARDRIFLTDRFFQMMRVDKTNIAAKPVFQFLEKLHLGCQMVTASSAALSLLGNCRRLKELIMYSSSSTDEFLNAVATLDGLTTLKLQYCEGFSTQGLLKLITLVKLEYLNLFGISAINDAVVAEIIDHCPKLASLEMGTDAYDNEYDPRYGKIIGGGGSDLSEAGLLSIQTAILEHRSALLYLKCGIAGTRIVPEMVAQLQEAVTQFSPLFKAEHWLREFSDDDSDD